MGCCTLAICSEYVQTDICSLTTTGWATSVTGLADDGTLISVLRAEQEAHHARVAGYCIKDEQ
jgi:hypothetical protein